MEGSLTAGRRFHRWQRGSWFEVAASVGVHLLVVVALVRVTAAGPPVYGSGAPGGGIAATDTLWFLVGGGRASGDLGQSGAVTALPAAAPAPADPLVAPSELAVPQEIEEPTGAESNGRGLEGGIPDSVGLGPAAGVGGFGGQGGRGIAGTGAGTGLGSGFGGAGGPPRPLHLVVPRLPPGVDAERARGVSVMLLIEVRPDGTTGEVSIERGSGIRALDDAAREAAQRMRYAPGPEPLRQARAEIRF